MIRFFIYLFQYWWYSNWNQYGLLKLLTINNYGTYIDGLKISSISLEDLNITYKSDLSFKIAIPKSAKNVGGLTIYGENFGNYNQNILIKSIYDH